MPFWPVVVQSRNMVDAMSATSTMSAKSTNSEPAAPRLQTDEAGCPVKEITVDFLDEGGFLDMSLTVGNTQA